MRAGEGGKGRGSPAGQENVSSDPSLLMLTGASRRGMVGQQEGLQSIQSQEIEGDLRVHPSPHPTRC